VDGTWHPWDDENDDADNAEFDSDESGLDALDDYIPDSAIPEAGGEQELSSPLYAVTNPPGTVTVTVYLDGRIHHVELAAKLTDMSERELADEVRVIAELARQRARSELHAFIIEGVRMLGHEPAAMRDSLIRELDMPTPEQAASATARVFSTRYSSDDEGDR
jgi:hypothetical protein